MIRLLLAIAVLASGCVSKPELPDGVFRETLPVRIGREDVAVDFYRRAGNLPGPMAVIVHGFLADKERMAHWGMLLAREGFVAAVPTNPTLANDRRNTAAIVGLVRAGRAGRWPVRGDGRMVLVGFSRGGYETMLAAAELGGSVDAWIGLDLVDRNGEGKRAAEKVRVPGLALLADPAPLNANGNARGMLSHYGGLLEVARFEGTGHLDAESPRCREKFGFFEGGVLDFLRRTVPR